MSDPTKPSWDRLTTPKLKEMKQNVDEMIVLLHKQISLYTQISKAIRHQIEKRKIK